MHRLRLHHGGRNLNILVMVIYGVLALWVFVIAYILAQHIVSKMLEGTPDRVSKYYADKTLGKKFVDMKDRLIQYTLGTRVLKVDVSFQKYQTMQDSVAGTWSEGYSRYDRWTSDATEDLQRQGYLKVDGLYDSIVYSGVPVFMRINNAKIFDVHVKDANGNFLYSQDTAATLHDSMTSNATQNFLKGMNRVAWQTMDLQKIVMIAIIGVGAIFGMYMLGFFH